MPEQHGLWEYVAQTSGLPSKISISANEMDTQDNFSSITTIGDVTR